MCKFVLILVAVVSCAAGEITDTYNQDHQNQNLYQDDQFFYPNQPQSDWNNFANEGNGIPSFPNVPEIDWMKYVNGNGNGHAPEHNQSPDCGPTYEYQNFPGMQEWCRTNCFHLPSYCPITHCKCW